MKVRLSISGAVLRALAEYVWRARLRGLRLV